MTTSLRAFLLPLLAALAAAAPAQGKKPAKPEKPAKTEKPAKADKNADKAVAPKDDAVTAKDPVIVAIDKFVKAKVGKKREDWKTAMPRPPEVKFAADRDYLWHVETTKGEVVVRLLPQKAPRHVESTIYLARAGFYDGLVFPRVLKGFMAQGGSPTNTQSGNAGYTLDHEFSDEKHDGPGVLSAANSGQPNTDGSQFFLTFVATPHLDGKHTVFGRVVQGLDVLKVIEACGVEKDGEVMSDPPGIVRAWITVAEAAATGGKAGTDGSGDKPAGGGR